MKYISECTDRMILLADSVKETQQTVNRKELFEWVRNGEEIYGVNAEKELIYSLHSLAPLGRKVRKSDLVYAGEKLKKDYKHYLSICTTRGTGGKWHNYFIGNTEYQKAYMATVYYIDVETGLLGKDTGGELFVPMPKNGTNKKEDFIVKFKDKPELRIANNDCYIVQDRKAVLAWIDNSLVNYNVSVLKNIHRYIKANKLEDLPVIEVPYDNRQRGLYKFELQKLLTEQGLFLAFIKFTNSEQKFLFMMYDANTGFYGESEMVNKLLRGSYFAIDTENPDEAVDVYNRMYNNAMYDKGYIKTQLTNTGKNFAYLTRKVSKLGVSYRQWGEPVNSFSDINLSEMFEDTKHLPYSNQVEWQSETIFDLWGLDGVFRYDKRALEDWRNVCNVMGEKEKAKRVLLGIGEYGMNEKGELFKIEAGRNGKITIPKNCKKIMKGSIRLSANHTLILKDLDIKSQANPLSISTAIGSKAFTIDFRGCGYELARAIMRQVHHYKFDGIYLVNFEDTEVLAAALLLHHFSVYKGVANFLLTCSTDIKNPEDIDSLVKIYERAKEIVLGKKSRVSEDEIKILTNFRNVLSESYDCRLE